MEVEIVLPYLEPWQKEVYDVFETYPRDKTICIKAKRQVGKSVLAIVLLIKHALLRRSCSVVVEPVLDQSRRVFKQLCDFLDGSGVIKSANSSLLTIEFVNKSTILFKSGEQKDTLRGLTVSSGGLLVIDEAAQIPDEIIELLYPTVDANHAPILMISTPLFTDGKFYNIFTSNSENVITFDWCNYDTSKYLPAEKLELRRLEMSPLKFQCEYLGQFIEEGGSVFTNIQKCINNNIVGDPVFGGIDFGSGNNGDFTCITLMTADGKVVKMEYFNDEEPSKQVSRLAGIINAYPTLKTVQAEMNSIGAVYFDYLKKELKKPGILQSFTTSNDTKRTIVDKLVSAFEKERIQIPNDKELIKELSHYAVEKTPSGKLTYNGIGSHDDLVMSLAIANDLISSSVGSYSISFGRKAARPLSPSERYH